MAGPTTAPDGTDQRSTSGPPPPARPRRRLPLPGRSALILIALAALLLGAGAVWALYGSPWLRTERVVARGTEALTPQEVREAAAVPRDVPLASVDTDAIAARLRRKLPRINSVNIVRSWPHTIQLNVTEREAAAVVKSGGRFVEVDAKGFRFATVDRAPAGVPQLELAVKGTPSLRRFGVDRLRREGVRVAVELPAAVHRDTRVITVRSYDSITLELTNGRTVVWGSSERGAAKSRALLALLKTAPNAQHFDVSAPSAPAVLGS